MKLKRYQTDTLAILRRYLEEARIVGPRNAYETITREPEQAGRLGRYAGSYAPLAKLSNVPYVCLRLPTGGGKTILGAYSIRVARDAWIEKDYPLVLWLAPTKTIRQQTAEALKNRRHPYRRALNEAFAGRVRAFDIADFTHIRPQDLRDHCCVVVGTIQTLRVKSTEGRKVYAHHEEMEPHFSTVLNTSSGLETLNGGGIKFSFANLLHLHRPLMIVDEAHNAVTGLTREMQARVNPCAIIEFTATPRHKSNILYSVTAHELKHEEMIKLPIVLAEHDTWQNAVSAAIATRAALAETACREPEYVRPIVLFQAQRKNQEVPFAVLKKHLLEIEQVPENRIAVATGNQRELDGVDLFDPECEIEYVITVEALKEGWDCSFAYVFCSLSRIKSARNVEQLLGRVLRMPYARRRKAADLNKAHAFVCEPSFGEAARALVDKLVAMGFEEAEAQENIQSSQRKLYGQQKLFEPIAGPTFRHELFAGPKVISTLLDLRHERLTVQRIGDEKVEIAIIGAVDEFLEQRIYEALPEAEHGRVAEALATYRRRVRNRLSPAERGQVLQIPRLMTIIQGDLKFADSDVFMEHHEWSLLDHPARLGAHEFNIRLTARSFEIDVDRNGINYRITSEREQLELYSEVEGWTPEALAIWLERQVREIDLHPNELLKWLRDLIDHLVRVRDLSISALMQCKFLLARRIRDKIDEIRRTERERVYQRYLLAPHAKPKISFDHNVTFRAGMYRNVRRYRGHWRPRKHFLGPDLVPAFDGATDGEEVACAQVIDSLPDVLFWLRNVARHPASFSLPTATGRFYPDFIAKLVDGRLFVVEYKGAHIAESSDTAEKRTIGKLWQRQSGGKGLFLIVEREIDGKDVHQQLMECIHG